MALSVQSGLVLHLEADHGIATSGSAVTNWRDASGNANDLLASGAPTLSTAPSGARAILFDGVDDKLERVLGLSGLPSGNGDRTVFFVVDYLDPKNSTAGAIFGDNQANQTFGLVAAKTGELMVQGFNSANDIASGTEGVSRGFFVQSAVLQSGELSQYVNGALRNTSLHDFNTDLERIVVGGGVATGFSQLKASAFLVYDRALSAAERAEVETYLQQKYLDTGTNQAPIAVDDLLAVPFAGIGEVNILRNDEDPDGGLPGTSITIVEGPRHGEILGIDPATGSVSYRHDGSPTGLDSFTYRLTDADGIVSRTATATLDISVDPLPLVGFADELVLTRAQMNANSSFFQPISMAFLPDNRMLLVSKDGEILIADPETGASRSFMQLNNIDVTKERGLLDITLDPNFETNGHFYLYYTPGSPKHAQISRFTIDENSGGLTARGDLSSEYVVWQDTDGYLACCHYGGGLDFGPDGKLWLTTSDKFQTTTPGEGADGGKDLPLDLTSSSGKIIRVNKDGSVPDGSDGQPANPWASATDGIDDYIWGYGLRNPFRARWDEEYGQMYIGEVGGNQQLLAHDDLHTTSLKQGGAFYGWPFYEGTPSTYVNAGKSPYDPASFPAPDGDIADRSKGDHYSAPIWSLAHNGKGASLTGGLVYRGDMFPAAWDGVYFYGDYTRDYIRYLILTDDGLGILGDYAFKPSPSLPGTTNEVVSIEVGADGALYYAMIASGEIRRITHDGANRAPEILSATLAPITGEPPLAVTFDATVRDAEGDAMTYSVNFGDGAVAKGTVDASGIISVGHTYTTSGGYSVTLSVSDGSHTVRSQVFTVETGDANDAPQIAGADSSVSNATAGVTEVTFTATATDADGDPMSYTWHFGDGTKVSGTVPASGTVTASHVYATDGSYSAFLEVGDGQETTVSGQVQVQVGQATEVPVTNGLVLLLQSDIKVGLGSGSTVASWLDGSGQGNNLFAQGNPQLVQNRTPSGEPAIVFDGTDDLLQRFNTTDTIFNLPAGNADRTLFFVVKYVDPETTNAGLIYGAAGSNEAFGLVVKPSDADLTIHGQGKGNVFDSNVDGVAPGWLVQSAVLKAGVTSHYLDGTLIDSDPHAFATNVKKIILGADISGKNQSQMEIAAVLVYDRALGDTARGQVDAFLRQEYFAAAPGDAAPVAADDSFVTSEDTALSGNVLVDNGNGADTDAEGGSLAVSLVSGVGHGTLALSPDGSFTYRPALDFHGTDEFIYRVSDGNGGTDEATVTLTVTPVDDPVDAVDDRYATTAGTTLSVGAARGVLANDTDPDGGPKAASLVSGVGHGTLTLGADGSFAYAPAAGFTGTDEFVYRVTGGDTATVRIDVGSPPAGIPVGQGLVAAYEADENVSTLSGNVVQGWLDGSGRGNDLTASGDPTLVAGATPTGRPAIVFDGAGDLLQRVQSTDSLNGLPSGSGDRTMFFVVDYVAAEGVSSGFTYGSGTKNKAFGLVTKADDDLMVHGWGKSNDFDSNVEGAALGWLVQSVVLKDDAFSHYLDGRPIGSGTHVFATALQKLVLGAEIAGLGESSLEVGAALIYDRALAESERIEVEEYLQTKYVDEGYVFA